MLAKYVVNRLSHTQRERLIAHVAAPQHVISVGTHGMYSIRRTTVSLVQEQLVRYTMTETTHTGHVPIKPRFTVLTEFGREVAAGVLAEYAEQLVAAGCLDPGVMIEIPSPKLCADDAMTTRLKLVHA